MCGHVEQTFTLAFASHNTQDIIHACNNKHYESKNRPSHVLVDDSWCICHLRESECVNEVPVVLVNEMSRLKENVGVRLYSVPHAAGPQKTKGLNVEKQKAPNLEYQRLSRRLLRVHISVAAAPKGLAEQCEKSEGCKERKMNKNKREKQVPALLPYPD